MCPLWATVYLSLKGINELYEGTGQKRAITELNVFGRSTSPAGQNYFEPCLYTIGTRWMQSSWNEPIVLLQFPDGCSLITVLFLHSPDKQLLDEPVSMIRNITQIAEGDEEESCPIEPWSQILIRGTLFIRLSAQPRISTHSQRPKI